MNQRPSKLLLAFLAIFLLGLIFPTEYGPLDNINFDIASRINSNTTLYSSTYTIYTEDFIKSEMAIAEESLERFSKSSKLASSLCKAPDLNMFIVSTSVINDKDRYPVTANNVGTRWALYDPYPNNINLVAILLTEHEPLIINQF